MPLPRHAATRRALFILPLLACAALPAGMIGQAAAATPNYSLAVSSQANRSSAQPLAGKTYVQPASMYVFTTPATNVRRVSFYLDDPTRSRPARLVDTVAPFDFAGSALYGTAKPLATATLSATSHTITAAIEANGKTSLVSSSFNVAPAPDTTPPALTWTTPAAGATVSGLLWESTNSGPSGPCETAASDNRGVTKVVFSVDGTVLNEENEAPYTCKFDTTTVADGSHTLKAVAYDAAGNTTSAQRTVNVSNTPGDTTAPTVTWMTPASGPTVSGLLWEATNSGPSGPCEASASDNRGVTKVVFSVDGTVLNEENGAPYSCKFDTTTVADGSHTLKAVAYDAAGNSTSAQRTVNVDNTPGDTTSPTVTWTKPASGATVSGFMWEASNSGPSGPCEVGATDATGVTKVVFHLDGTLLNTENGAPWNCKLDTTPLANGSHTLKAIAYDAAGNTTSAERTVNVQNVGTRTEDPSGEATPVGDLPGWRQIFVDDFSQDVPLGSFPAAVSTRWGAYAGVNDTSGNGSYDAPRTISIANGMMDMFIRTETINGVKKHLVAAPMPKMPGTWNLAQTYGRYAVRFRSDPLPQYKTAWLLWPTSETWPRDGEIDFPEGNLNGSICAFMHRQGATVGNDQDGACSTSTYPTWHTAVIEWTPTVCRFILDGKVLLAPTSRIPNTPMRWILQTETALSGGAPADATSGHVQVDWVAAYARAV